MKIASVADVKARLRAYLKETAEGPVIVTRNGKAVAVLLGVTDEDELKRGAGHSPKFQGAPQQVPASDRRDRRHSPRRLLAEVEAESRKETPKEKQGQRRRKS